MMIAIVLSLVLESPIFSSPLKMCITSCTRTGAYSKCFYELRPKCMKRQTECVDLDAVDCVPIVVDLGTFENATGYHPAYTPENWPAENSNTLDRTMQPRAPEPAASESGPAPMWGGF